MTTPVPPPTTPTTDHPTPRQGRSMDGLTRRSLLTGSAVVGATALLAGATRVSLDAVLRRTTADALPTGSPILVVVTLYGGNDWLNTVVPHADPAYQSARGRLAMGAGEVLRLDEQVGLNPGLPKLAEEWSAGRLGIVRGVGLPQPQRSHFRAMDIWQTGSPDAPADTGWLGRWLDSAGADPLSALNIGTVLPPMLVGRRTAAAALAIGRKAPLDPTTLAALSATDPQDGAAAALVTGSYAAYGRVRDLAATVNAPPSASSKPAPGAAPSGTARAEDFSAQLRIVADLVRAGAPPRVYAVSLTGFDTHAGELERQRGLLAELDAGLATLRERLAGHERARDVVTLVYSEFGRRVAANGSEGTDHGSAGDVLLLGDRVAGGWHGQAPSLTALLDGDLRVTTDFRDVYAAVLAGVLGADPDLVLGAGRQPVPGLLR